MWIGGTWIGDGALGKRGLGTTSWEDGIGNGEFGSLRAGTVSGSTGSRVS
jgi:hypothetical protein